MSQKKSFLSKVESLKPKIPVDRHVEQHLLPRLKFMGHLLLVFSVCAFAYTVLEEFDLIPQIPEGEKALPFTLSEIAPLDIVEVRLLNGYVVGVSFALVGGACILTARHKGKRR